MADLPTFEEIKADLPPFGKKRVRFYARKIIIAIIYLLVTQNEPIFFVLTSPNSTEITKLVQNNNISIYLCMLFAMTSKVRKKRKNFQINRESGRFKKTLCSALSEDLAGLMWGCVHLIDGLQGSVLMTEELMCVFVSSS